MREGGWGMIGGSWWGWGGGVKDCKGRIHQIHCGQVAQQVKRGGGGGRIRGGGLLGSPGAGGKRGMVLEGKWRNR